MEERKLTKKRLESFRQYLIREEKVPQKQPLQEIQVFADTCTQHNTNSVWG